MRKTANLSTSTTKPSIDALLASEGFQSLSEYKDMLKEKEFLSSSIPEIDELVANGRTRPDGTPFGGFPRGAITEISGAFGCYKTTIMKRCASQPGVKALYIDTEGSFSHDDLDNPFDMVMEGNIEKIWGLVNKALDQRLYDLIVIDSIAGATTEQEFSAGNTLQGFNTSKARALNQWMRGLLPYIQKSNTALVFVNQLRDKVGVAYTDTYTPGGKALEFYPSLRLQLFAPKSEMHNGVQGIRVKVSKSRYGPKNDETKFKFDLRKEFKNYEEE